MGGGTRGGGGTCGGQGDMRWGTGEVEGGSREVRGTQGGGGDTAQMAGHQWAKGRAPADNEGRASPQHLFPGLVQPWPRPLLASRAPGLRCASPAVMRVLGQRGSLGPPLQGRKREFWRKRQ